MSTDIWSGLSLLTSGQVPQLPLTSGEPDCSCHVECAHKFIADHDVGDDDDDDDNDDNDDDDNDDVDNDDVDNDDVDNDDDCSMIIYLKGVEVSRHRLATIGSVAELIDIHI